MSHCAAGGFFASGFKRAFKMKDFGQTIPGHGGVTDRFDCQMIMAMFAYVYYWNYVASTELAVGEALDVSAWWWLSRCARTQLNHAVQGYAVVSHGASLLVAALGSGCVCVHNCRSGSQAVAAGVPLGALSRPAGQSAAANAADTHQPTPLA